MHRTLVLLFILTLFTATACDEPRSEERKRSLTGSTLYNFASCTIQWDFDDTCTMDIGSFEYEHDTVVTCLDDSVIEITYTCEDASDDYCGVMKHETVTRTYHLVRTFTEADLNPQCDPPDEALMGAMRCALALSPNFYLLQEISYDICEANNYECTHGICLSVSHEIFAPYYVRETQFPSTEACLDLGEQMDWLSCFDDLLITGEYFLTDWGYRYR